MDNETNTNATASDHDTALEELEETKRLLSAGFCYEVGKLKREYTEKALNAQLAGKCKEANALLASIDALEALVDTFNDTVLVKTRTQEQLHRAVKNVGLPSEFNPDTFYETYCV